MPGLHRGAGAIGLHYTLGAQLDGTPMPRCQGGSGDLY